MRGANKRIGARDEDGEVLEWPEGDELLMDILRPSLEAYHARSIGEGDRVALALADLDFAAIGLIVRDSEGSALREPWLLALGWADLGYDLPLLRMLNQIGPRAKGGTLSLPRSPSHLPRIDACPATPADVPAEVVAWLTERIRSPLSKRRGPPSEIPPIVVSQWQAYHQRAQRGRKKQVLISFAECWGVSLPTAKRLLARGK
jgi:hypothetical protein